MILKTSHFSSLSSSSPIAPKQIPATQTPQPGETRYESSETTDTCSNQSLHGTQEHCRHQVDHRGGANEATMKMTRVAHVNTVHRSGRSKNMKQHALGCEYIQIKADSRQFTPRPTAGTRRDPCGQLIAAGHRKPPWSTTAFVCTFWKMNHQDVVNSGFVTEKFHDKCPQEWTKHAWNTL